MFFFLLIFLPNTVSRIGFKFQVHPSIHSLEPTCRRKSRYLVCELFLIALSKTSLVRTYYGHPERVFFRKFQTFGLGQTKVGGHLGYFVKKFNTEL